MVSDTAAGAGDLLARLTPMPAKVAAYADDTYFRETAGQLERAGIDAAAFATSHTLLLLKPDAIIARSIEPTLQWLHDNGFAVRSAHRIAVNRHLVRALWYYQWNIASPERRWLADLLVTLSDSLLLVVGESTPKAPGGAEVPVVLRFGELKGPTNPVERAPGQLRHLLGQHSYLLNLVHAPDDPADVLRELAIYLDEPGRARLFAEIASGAAGLGADGRADAVRYAHELTAEVPARSFDRAAALSALQRQIAEIPAGAGLLRDVAEGTDAHCAALLRAAWAAGWQLDPWLVVLLGSYVLPMRTQSGKPTLGTVSAHDWRASMQGGSIER